METPEFKAIVNPLDEKLRSIVDTDGKTEAGNVDAMAEIRRLKARSEVYQYFFIVVSS